MPGLLGNILIITMEAEIERLKRQERCVGCRAPLRGEELHASICRDCDEKEL